MSNNKQTLGFVGLGLIGGSIARAVRERSANDPGTDIRLIAYDPDPYTGKEAVSDGVIDVFCDDVDMRFAECDVVFLAAPVKDNETHLKTLLSCLRPDTLITDTGSVKAPIHRLAKKLNIEDRFIGGHPMTGSERTGYRNSRAVLLENAYYILTTTECTRREDLDLLTHLVRLMGAIPLPVEAARHDYITAAISHLPHIIAASLVNLVHDEDAPDRMMKTIAAGGFKDITRIASSSPEMWRQICLTNADNILPLLDHYIGSLQKARDEIKRHDSAALYALFDHARAFRDSFITDASGPIKRSYILPVEIEDKPGVIAQVATTLSASGISIKNIGVIHNREYERGTLHIELNSKEDLERAAAILKDHGFHTV